MIDARAGADAARCPFRRLLRGVGKPVVLVANKAEGRAGEAGVLEAFSLGFGEPVAISAEHGEGLGDLRDAIAADPAPTGSRKPARARTGPEQADPHRGCRPAQRRQVDAHQPDDRRGTAAHRPRGGDHPRFDRRRLDAGAATAFRLFDTAGLRRKARVDGKLEKLAVGDALRAIRFAEVVILVIDATQPFEKQDLQIADLVESEGRAIVIALDKWDLVEAPQRTLATLGEEAERLLPQLRGVALVPVSGLTGEGIDKLMAKVAETYEVWNRRLPTSKLNRWLAGIIERHPPPAVSGRRIKLRYLTQAKARPPSFVAFCSRPEALPDAWQRYLVNALRDDFKLPGVPIRLMLRKGENPYEGRKRKLTTQVTSSVRGRALAGHSNKTPLPSKSGDSILTMSGATASGGLSVVRIFARHRLRPHPGAQRPGVDEIGSRSSGEASPA